MLSYCPASTRKTTTTAKAKTYAAVLPACCCWNANSVHSYENPSGSELFASRSMMLMPWPKDVPGVISPRTSTAG